MCKYLKMIDIEVKTLRKFIADLERYGYKDNQFTQYLHDVRLHLLCIKLKPETIKTAIETSLNNGDFDGLIQVNDCSTPLQRLVMQKLIKTNAIEERNERARSDDIDIWTKDFIAYFYKKNNY